MSSWWASDADRSLGPPELSRPPLGTLPFRFKFQFSNLYHSTFFPFLGISPCSFKLCKSITSWMAALLFYQVHKWPSTQSFPDDSAFRSFSHCLCGDAPSSACVVVISLITDGEKDSTYLVSLLMCKAFKTYPRSACVFFSRNLRNWALMGWNIKASSFLRLLIYKLLPWECEPVSSL